MRHAMLLVIVGLWLPDPAVATISDPRLILHAVPGSQPCAPTPDCLQATPTTSLPGPGLATVYLLVQAVDELGPGNGTMSGAQAAFDWDNWQLLGVNWFCASGAFVTRAPSEPGPDTGTLTMLFDPVLEGSAQVLGWMRFQATSGDLRVIESAHEDGTHVQTPDVVPVVESARGRVKVGGLGIAPCDYGCNRPFEVSCATNTLEPPAVFTIGTGIETPVLGDVNDDQRIDVLVNGPSYVALLLASATGSFHPAVYLPIDIDAPLLEDRNADGILDLVGQAGGAIEIYAGAGDGTFGSPASYPAPAGAVHWHDLDQDGLRDAAAPHLGGLGVVMSAPGGGFGPLTTQPLPHPIQEFDLGDVTGDQIADLLVRSTDAATFDYLVYVFLGHGDGSFDVATPLLSTTSLVPGNGMLSDMNGDGLADASWVHYIDSFGDTSVAQRYAVAGGGFESGPLFTATPCASLETTAAVNTDGHPDLVTTAHGNCTSHAFCGIRATVEVSAGSPDGHFLEEILRCNFEYGRVPRVVLGHLDGDAALDVVAAADPAVIVFSSTAAAAIAPPQAPAHSVHLGSVPNPFRHATTLSVQLASPASINAVVYNSRGQFTRVLAEDRFFLAGSHRLRWDGTDPAGKPAAAGVYFVQIDTGTERVTEKILKVH